MINKINNYLIINISSNNNRKCKKKKTNSSRNNNNNWNNSLVVNQYIVLGLRVEGSTNKRSTKSV